MTTVERGKSYGADSLAIATPVEAGQVIFTVAGNESDKTYVTQTGTLYVGADEEADELSVSAKPAAKESSFFKTVSLDVTGDILRLWPDPAVVTP